MCSGPRPSHPATGHTSIYFTRVAAIASIWISYYDRVRVALGYISYLSSELVLHHNKLKWIPSPTSPPPKFPPITRVEVLEVMLTGCRPHHHHWHPHQHGGWRLRRQRLLHCRLNGAHYLLFHPKCASPSYCDVPNPISWPILPFRSSSNDPRISFSRVRTLPESDSHNLCRLSSGLQLPCVVLLASIHFLAGGFRAWRRGLRIGLFDDACYN